MNKEHFCHQLCPPKNFTLNEVGLLQWLISSQYTTSWY